MGNVNPDYETLKLVLILSGSMIGILLLIVGYFVKKVFSDQDSEIDEIKTTHRLEITEISKYHKEQMEKLSGMIDKVDSTVNSLKTVVNIIKSQQEERDPQMTELLKEHGSRLDEHGERIKAVEVTCNLRHR